MLKKCRPGVGGLVPEDQCPHPHPWCDCSCHREEGDEEEPRVRRAIDMPDPGSDGRPEAFRAQVTAPAAEKRNHDYPKDRGPCPHDGCDEEIPAAGAGRSSHLRKHARIEGLPPAPSSGSRSVGGVPVATVTVTKEERMPIHQPPRNDDEGDTNTTFTKVRALVVEELELSYTDEQRKLIRLLGTIDEYLET